MRRRRPIAGAHAALDTTVHVMALQTLNNADYLLGKLRSKTWVEFFGAGAPAIDVMFTVCDNVAGDGSLDLS